MIPGSAPEVAARVRRGDASAREIAEAALDRIARHDSSLGAFLHVTREEALRDAEAIDRRVAAGEDPGPLAGVPVALKDNLCTRGIPTTCASRILEGHHPLYDATAVRRLHEAGAVLVGKTNMDEFGMGSSSENSAFFPARNPWSPDRVAGGSSGGSAAAVASGMAMLALGSDTGGSVRQPGAFCGLYALKPTYGRVSRFGLVAYASSLDQIGGFARDTEGLAALYDAIAGPDDRDATTSLRPVESVDLNAGVAGLRVGLAEDLLDREGMEPDVAGGVRRAAAALEEAGACITRVLLPDADAAIAAYYLLAMAEASSNLARYDGVRYGLRVQGDGLAGMYRRTRSAGFGAEVKRRILLGTYALSAGYYDAFYLRAARARASMRGALARLFQDVDLVLLPTSPTTAFPLGSHAMDPLAMYLADVFTVLANLTGIPALSAPAGLDRHGLPIGAQVLAPLWREDLLFRAARALEQRLEKPAWPLEAA